MYALGCIKNDYNTKVVKEVEEWAAAHPHKTRQSEFLKQYPEARIDDTGMLNVCPAIISPAHRINGGGCTYYHKKCSECRREFWMQEELSK